MILVSFPLEKIKISCPYCALFFPPDLVHPTTSILYHAKSLAVASRQPAL